MKDDNLPAELAQKIASLWHSNRSIVKQRLHLLQRAADELEETRSLGEGLRAEALSAAHKLAGSLGMFGHEEASQRAHAIQMDLEAPGLPQPERLQEHVERLQTLLHDALL